MCLGGQLCPTLCDPMDCRLPGFSVRGALQARILEWVVISFSREGNYKVNYKVLQNVQWYCVINDYFLISVENWKTHKNTEINPHKSIWRKKKYSIHTIQAQEETIFNMLVTPWTGFPGGSALKNPTASAWDMDSISGSVRCPGEGNCNPCQYSAWEVSWTEEPGRLQSMGCKTVRHD